PWFFFSSRRRHTIFSRDWSSDVCSSDLFDAPGYRNAKTPSVKGHILASSMSTLRAKRRQLEALGTDGGLARMTVQDDDGGVTWRSEERRGGKERGCVRAPGRRDDSGRGR